MIVDLFAGPRGWSEGLRILGHDEPEIGYEVADAPVATARAAGHWTEQVDLLGYSPFKAPDVVTGLIASPTCRPFSTLGGKQGVGDRPILDTTLERMADGDDDAYDQAFWEVSDPRSVLTLTPMRWILAHSPTWVAMEQVAAVMPLWETYARALTRLGYSVDTGVLDCSKYGVPQARRRAFFVARRDGQVAALPEPTTADAPVAMATALGWPTDPAELAALVRSKANDQTGTEYDATWPAKRPSTVVAGRLLIGHPGSNANRFNGSTKSRNDGIRLTVAEAAALQTFPQDHPWQGTEAEIAQQIGDAVPPRMGAHVLAPLVGASVPAVAA